MIKYRLRCRKEHEFEAWFRDSEDYDRQEQRGLVRCPTCNSKKVSKALMAPRIAKTKARAAPSTTAAKSASLAHVPDDKRQELVAMMRNFRKEVEKNAEYVGDKFADEARKIHYEEAPARNIYGEATIEEAKTLHDEGVEFMPLPKLPEDRN